MNYSNEIMIHDHNPESNFVIIIIWFAMHVKSEQHILLIQLIYYVHRYLM